MTLIDKAMELLGMPSVVRYARRSSKWPPLRAAHLKAHPWCIACGDLRKPKEVHHIDPVHYDPSRELDPTNLVTLCSEYCHITWGHLGDFKLRNLTVVDDCNAQTAKHAAAVVEYHTYPFPHPHEAT